jgi:copper(I)-binding protein
LGFFPGLTSATILNAPVRLSGRTMQLSAMNSVRLCAWRAYVFTLIVGAAPLAAQTADETYHVGAILIEAPWSWTMPGDSKMAGGYMKITNIGRESDRLVGGSAEVSGRFEMHRSVANGDVRMEQLAGGLEIRPGETIELRPGAVHAMLLDLRQELKRGDVVKGTLIFERAGKVAIRYQVSETEPQRAPAADDHQHH